jgi:hypothetical protein
MGLLVLCSPHALDIVLLEGRLPLSMVVFQVCFPRWLSKLALRLELAFQIGVPSLLSKLAFQIGFPN